jgi:hypothetical protein
MRQRESVSNAEGDAQSGPSGLAVVALPEAEACVEVHGGMSRATKAVLFDGDLLGCVWDFLLGGNGRQDVRLLEHLSLVCRKWREVGAWDAWWKSIKQDMLPLLWEEEGEEAASSRGRVLEFGRFLKGQRNPPRMELGDDWVQRLEAHVEIFDRMDGLQMLSVRRPVRFIEDDYDLRIDMTFPPDLPAMQVETAPFSAASRDPLGRFANVEDYLTMGHKEEYPCDLCIRVTLRDTQSGMMALVWETDKRTDRNVEITGDFEEEGSVEVIWFKMPRQKTLMGRLVHPSSVWVSVREVPGQSEDVSEQDRLYTIDTRPNKLDFSVWNTHSVEYFKDILQVVLPQGHANSGIA